MTTIAEARRMTPLTTKSRREKRLSRLSYNRRNPLYQAVFATPSSRRTARTAVWNCINLGKIIEIMVARLIQFKDSSNLRFQGCAFSKRGMQVA